MFSKTFPQESVNNLFNPESYILTQRKIYAYNTQIKNSIVLKKNPISLYIACMEINKKKTQGEDRKKKKIPRTLASVYCLELITWLPSNFFRDIVKTLQTCFFGNFSNA